MLILYYYKYTVDAITVINMLLLWVKQIFSCFYQLFPQHENIPFVDGDSTVVSILNELCPVQQKVLFYLRLDPSQLLIII